MGDEEHFGFLKLKLVDGEVEFCAVGLRLGEGADESHAGAGQLCVSEGLMGGGEGIGQTEADEGRGSAARSVLDSMRM